MATEAQIATAVRERTPGVNASPDRDGYHLLAMARADEAYEAAERRRARALMSRQDHAGYLLEMLGLVEAASV